MSNVEKHYIFVWKYNLSLLKYMHVQGVGSKLDKGLVTGCAIGLSGEVGEFEPSLEEGVPYITGIQLIIYIINHYEYL